MSGIISQVKPCNHSNIQGSHPDTSVNFEAVLSKEQSLKHDDSCRFSREISLQFQHCPHCAGKDIVFNGKSPVGTQRYKCKPCGRQFVCQMESIYPRLGRRDVFYREFDKEKYGYWKPAMIEVLAYIESHKGKLLINKTLKYHFNEKITTQREYDVLTFYIVREVYNLIMAR